MAIQKSFFPLFRKRLPRKFHIHCIGEAKTGTTTVAKMFKGSYRAEHESETEATNRFIIDYLESKIDAGHGANFLLERDRRLNLELNR